MPDAALAVREPLRCPECGHTDLHPVAQIRRQVLPSADTLWEYTFLGSCSHCNTRLLIGTHHVFRYQETAP